MKKNRILSVIVLVFFVYLTFLLGIDRSTEAVDEYISTNVINSEWKTLGYKERVKVSRRALLMLAFEFRVYNVCFNDEIHTFNYMDGSLGGIMLEDFNPEMN